MFTRPCICLLACAASGWLAGCSLLHHHHTADAAPSAATGSAQPEKKSTGADQKRDMESPPHVHMTRDEVLAKYGEPARRTYSEEGERWLYRLNEREASIHRLNPFDLTDRTLVRYGTITFDERDRVQKFHWDAGPGSGRD